MITVICAIAFQPANRQCVFDGSVIMFCSKYEMLIICMWWTCVCLFRMILILPLCTLHTAHYITVLNGLPFCSTYSIISSISRFSLDNFVFVFFLDLLKFVFFFSINLVRKLNDLRSRITSHRVCVDCGAFKIVYIFDWKYLVEC